ncbi:MAG: hypothetical protein M0Q70_13665 [Dokdonella sp.]|nr:hypothetical protein [Dokdonella sp.]
MKVLSLALIGAFGYAGVASAACPTSAVPPWSSEFAFQGTTTIATPGYAGTECRLDSAINAGAGGAAGAAVIWNGGAVEPRYRAHFIVNVDSLTGQGLLDAVQLFTSTSASAGQIVRFSVFGSGGGKNLAYAVRNDANPIGLETGVVPLSAGENHVEFDFEIGASNFQLWVNNNDPNAPTKTVAINNDAAVTGVDTSSLGLAGPTAQFVQHFAGTAVGFDQFDSRRQNFIGY